MTSPEGSGPGSRAVGFGLGGSATPGSSGNGNGSGSYANGAPVAKATEPAPQGASPARSMQAPAVKDTMESAETAKAPSVPAPAAKPAAAEAPEPAAKDAAAPAAPAAPAAKDAPATPAPAPAAAAKEPAAKESAPAKEPAAKPAPVAKESAAPAPAPTPEPAKPAPAPRPAPAPSASTPATPAQRTPKPDRGEAPVPKSKLGRTRGTAGTMPPPRVRRARLKIANIDPWSVMKVSFLFSVALGVILLVAVTLLWALLDFMGFFDSVADTISDISKDSNGGGFDVVSFFSLPRVLGMTTIVALIDIILITALATLGAYLYNLSTDLVGGVEVTLAEEE